MVPDLVSELTPSAEKNLYLKKKKKKVYEVKRKTIQTVLGANRGNAGLVSAEGSLQHGGYCPWVR